MKMKKISIIHSSDLISNGVYFISSHLSSFFNLSIILSKSQKKSQKKKKN